MATRKITITIDEIELERIRHLVTAGEAPSVSGFVQAAVKRSLDAERLWTTHLATILEATGGPPTEAETAWLDEIFSSENNDGAAR